MTHVHAILLLVCPLLALSLLILKRRRRPTLLQVTIAFALSVIMMFLAMTLNVHFCDAGQPVSQWLIAGCCAFLVLAWVDPRPLRRTAGAALLAATLGLSCQFTSLVHEPGWTGNPAFSEGSLVLRSIQAEVNEGVLPEVSADARYYPAGWLRDLPPLIEPAARTTVTAPATTTNYTAVDSLRADLRWMDPRRTGTRRVIQPVWHSWFTGLYRYTRVAQDFWYPGGKLADGLLRLELRDREEPTTQSATVAGG